MSHTQIQPMPFEELLDVKSASEHCLGAINYYQALGVTSGRWLEPSAAKFREVRGCPMNVGLNTTLAVKEELESLQVAEFDSRKAIQETIQGSERTKILLNTRATEVVNVSRSQLQFTKLVSVDVHEDQLISHVLQDRLVLVPTPYCHDNAASDIPSLPFFMNSELSRQKPFPTDEKTVKIKANPLTHHMRSTFDLYRQQRRCEGTQ